jgi:hypothetical protein
MTLHSTVIGLTISLTTCAVAAQHICWVKHVKSSDVEVKVYLEEDYRYAVRSIVRKNSIRENVKGTELEFIALNEGDLAYLMSGAHDTCKVTAQRRDGRLGAVLDALSQSHGMPASTGTEFLVNTE